MNKLVFTILSMLDKGQQPVKSGRIARHLSLQGFDLSERTVRYHLQMLDERGYTEHQSKKGRTITAKGRQELSFGFVCERVGYIINKINNLAFLTDFSPYTMQGKLILNVSYIPEEQALDALRIMSAALCSPYAFSSRIIVKTGGEHIGDLTVPRGCVGIGTVCSMSLNGILLKAGIPVTPKYGGTIRVENHLPKQFTSFIGYEKSSVAPLEIFMKSGMTDITAALAGGTGEVLGSFREVPEVCLEDVRGLYELLKSKGLGGLIVFGQPHQSVLGMPVTPGTAGMLVLGGLNAVAALAEAGIPSENYSMDTICEFGQLSPVSIYADDFAVAVNSAPVAHAEALRSRQRRYGLTVPELKQSTF